MGKEAADGSASYQLYWGETHHNTYQRADQEPSLDEILSWARNHLHFYAAAYYMARQHQRPLKPGVEGASIQAGKGHPSDVFGHSGGNWQGVFFEEEKDQAWLEREWAEVQEATRKHNEPNRFITFPGYEWQGDCRWGDHNVYYIEEGGPIYADKTLPALYENLRRHRALAIPHHTAYKPGMRAPKWAYCDEKLSPFMEIYSVHGCSERDGIADGLRRNPHMGPGTGGGTYEDLLNQGNHVGVIGSTDNWTDCPGRWGHGLMGCWAESLDRESLWEAFCARRVYAVTGDRIRLWVSVNGKAMGSVNPFEPTRSITVKGEGADWIDRVEVLRNNKCIYSYYPDQRCISQGKQTWKLRMEMGWGPKMGEIPVGDRSWDGRMQLSEGGIRNWEPCWMHGGQSVPRVRGNTAEFSLISPQNQASEPFQNGLIFTLEASPEAMLHLHLNGRFMSKSLAELARHSRLIAFEDESRQLLESAIGLTPDCIPRMNTPFIFSHKCRVHQLVPENGFKFHFTFEDEEAGDQPAHYRVRVVQRNGQRAWSSPVWFGEKHE